jgi:chemotaxis protein methyltransferase WspC
MSDATAIRNLEERLSRRIGLDPASISPGLVARAVRSRMAERGLNDLEAYAQLAASSDEECQALVEDVVIPESWFFRDDRPFRLLRELARTGWLANPARPPLRVLSLPCARGEEPYSIVMTLVDAGLPSDRFIVDAVDVSARVLAHAELGVYSTNAFRGVDPSTRDRYFRPCHRGFELDSAIRTRVRFRVANLFDPDLLLGEPPYDVVFCRNLLIYLTVEARSRALAILDRLLAADGLLVVGHADRLGEVTGSACPFVSIGDPGSFAFRKRSSSVPAARPAPPSPRSRIGPRTGTPRAIPSPSTAASPRPIPASASVSVPASSSIPDTAATPFREAAEVSNQAGAGRADTAANHGEPPPCTLVERVAELANQGLHREAIEACRRLLSQKGPNAPAYYLLGAVHQAAGDRRQAEDCFHKAVYLDPSHDEALLALALLAERRGDLGAAAGYRRRAERAVLRKAPENS